MGSSAIKINKFNYFGRCSTDNIESVTEYVSAKIRPLIKVPQLLAVCDSTESSAFCFALVPIFGAFVRRERKGS